MWKLRVAPFLGDRTVVAGLSLPSEHRAVFVFPVSDITLPSEPWPVFVDDCADIALPSGPRPVIVERGVFL